MKSRSRFSRTQNDEVSQAHLVDCEDFDDYESNTFVIETSSSGNKRRIDNSDNRTIKKRMEDTLIEGSSKAITPQNKGYTLLQKFGYTGTGGLGKDSTGINEPISIEINLDKHKDKSGIGIAEQKREKNAKFQNDLRLLSELKEGMVCDFKKRMQYEHEMKRMRGYVISAEKVIYEYDSRKGINFNSLWPSSITSRSHSPPVSEEGGEGEDKCSRSDAHQQNDLWKADDHTNYLSESLLEDDYKDSEKVLERLQECLYYLRNQYLFCLFCGCQYNDSDDLVNNCPGLLEDDH